MDKNWVQKVEALVHESEHKGIQIIIIALNVETKQTSLSFSRNTNVVSQTGLLELTKLKIANSAMGLGELG